MAIKIPSSDQKLRGGYYTPRPIANFLAEWAIVNSNAQVLEPSCGDGNILVAAASQMLKLGNTPHNIATQLVGVEFDVEEASKAHKRLRELGINPNHNGTITTGDFFEYCYSAFIENRQFDSIVANPPFIRYQDFREEHRTIAFAIMNQAGLNPNRLTNAWVPFLIASALLLNKNGRLAIVIPAELFQVNYAAEVRLFLSNYFRRITIVTFRKLVFEGIQQEVVLLLGERAITGYEGIRILELNGLQDLTAHQHRDFTEDDFRPIDHSKDKWTQYYLTPKEIFLLRSLRSRKDIPPSSKFIDVDVGIVTGQNKFFVMNENQVKEHRLENFVQPVVSRSAHLKGTRFTDKSWQSNVEDNLPAMLFMPPNVSILELPESARQYVQIGEADGHHKGYKCSIRRNWYAVPSVWIPDAFMLRQVHGYPKLVLNESQATCTDTVHRVKFIGNIEPHKVVSGFINSLTFAFSEIMGRGYGGGVQTFEPSEAEQLPLPLMGAERIDFDEIDFLMRQGAVTTALNITDQILLRDGLGLDQNEVTQIRAIWVKLRERRMFRRKTAN